jgi:hypothetical protein
MNTFVSPIKHASWNVKVSQLEIVQNALAI